MAVIDRLYANLCLGIFGIEDLGDRPNFSSQSASTTDISGLASGAPYRALTVNGETYLLNGWDHNKIISGTTIREAGADAAPVPTIAAGGGTGLTGSYTALYTYYDSARDFETCPFATAPTVKVLANQSLAVTVVASSNSRFDKIRIYRNANGVPATLLLDRTVDNVSGTYQLTQADSALGSAVSYTNYRPPPCKYVAKTATRIFWGGARPFNEGTANVTFDSTTVQLTVAPPPELYTRNAEAPFYFQRAGGPRYGITAISGTTLTLATAYKGSTESGVSYSIFGLKTRVYYADLSTTGLVKSESWKPAFKFDVGIAGDHADRGVQEEITALREHGNKIYAWLKETIWYFDPLISQRKRTRAKCGTLSDKTIKEDRDGFLLYMGTDMQVYAFDGNSTRCVSEKMRNRFAKQSRYNMNLMEFAFARYDRKEGFYELHRPASGCSLGAMRYVVDVYDDYTGEWTEKVPPRITAVTEIGDNTRSFHVGVDTLGKAYIVDDYENSASLANDTFPSSSLSELTSVAGEISPGSNSKGKLAIVYTSTTVKGAKMIVGTQSSSAQTEDLTDAVTVAAGDKYVIGGWYGVYETGWMDFGEPDLYKSIFFLKGTFIKNSMGYLYVEVYTDESTSIAAKFRINVATERSFKRHLPARGKQIKFIFRAVTQLTGWGLREMSLSLKVTGQA